MLGPVPHSLNQQQKQKFKGRNLLRGDRNCPAQLAGFGQMAGEDLLKKYRKQNSALNEPNHHFVDCISSKERQGNLMKHSPRQIKIFQRAPWVISVKQTPGQKVKTLQTAKSEKKLGTPWFRVASKDQPSQQQKIHSVNNSNNNVQPGNRNGNKVQLKLKRLQNPERNYLSTKRLQVYSRSSDKKDTEVCTPCATADYQDSLFLNIKQLKSTMSSSFSGKQPVRLTLQDFRMVRDIGQGRFGHVKLVVHNLTGLVFSLKIMSKEEIRQSGTQQNIIKEVKIQSFLDHANIVKLYSIFDDATNIYLLMEYCCSGNMYSEIKLNGKLTERKACGYLAQICQALGELHSHRIVHRDIKPENIVISYGMAKVCDFGWSTLLNEGMRSTLCGSPLFISPELLQGQYYDEKVDIWALGVLAYELMTGMIPFDIVTEKDLTKIIKSEVVYPGTMSDNAKSFLKLLLQKNPSERMSVEEIMTHPFLLQHDNPY